MRVIDLQSTPNFEDLSAEAIAWGKDSDLSLLISDEYKSVGQEFTRLKRHQEGLWLSHQRSLM
jgi:hypothetical protein